MRLCQVLTARYGSPAEMAEMFRAEPRLKIKHVIAEYPEVGIRFLRSRLLYGGLTPQEMVGRIGHFARPKPTDEHCRRCGVRLYHQLVLEVMSGNPPLRVLHEKTAGYAQPLCGWCATEIAQMTLDRRDEDRPRWFDAGSLRGRPPNAALGENSSAATH